MNNILKNTIDEECKNLTSKCIHECIHYRDNNNIVRKFLRKEVFEWESKIYLKFLENGMFPLASAQHNQLTYYTSGLVSFRTFSKKWKFNVPIALQELFSFINTFKTMKFLHGNLHVDNVFVDPKTFTMDMQFYVIDYANSYILGKRYKPNYKRSSYIGDYDKRNNEFMHWDFITMYISLKYMYKDNPEDLMYLDNLACTFINRKLLEKYIQTLIIK